MHIGGSLIIERDIEPGIAIAKSVRTGTSDAVEKHAEAGIVDEIDIEIAVVAAGGFQGDVDIGDDPDCDENVLVLARPLMLLSGMTAPTT